METDASANLITKRFDDFINLPSENSDIVEVGKKLLIDIRLSGRTLTDSNQRSEYAQMARDIGERLLEVSGIYYAVHLEPLDEQRIADSPESQEIIAAKQLLSTMPLNVVPEPASLPPGSRMPYTRNPLFVGREECLKDLAATLKGGETAVIGHVAAATGLGGIGKTQLAVEFVHRYGQFFAGGVFWLSFADVNAIAYEVAACGGTGYMELRPDFDNLNLDEQVGAVQAAWRSELPRLLVFDNCEDEQLLDTWRPTTGSCRVLLTSRRAIWDETLGLQSLPLGVLSRGESVALLRKYRANINEDDMNAIAEELGDLPLALHLAGSFLSHYRSIESADYLTQLRQSHLLHHRSMQGEWLERSPTASNTRKMHVYDVFSLSYDRLDEQDRIDAIAIALLARAAYFAPGEPIPRDVLLATILQDNAHEDAVLDAEAALNRLLALGLLEKEEKAEVVLHRLLVAFVQEKAAPNETAQADVEQTLFEKARSINEDLSPFRMNPLLKHLYIVTERAKDRKDELAAGLCDEFGGYLWIIGDYTRARPYAEHALEITEQIYDSDDPLMTRRLTNLAILLQHQGEYTEARQLFERDLDITEKTFGLDHPNTAISLNNLAELLREMEEYEHANLLYERALIIAEEKLGEKHPDTAMVLNNLGLIFFAQNDYAAAIQCYERALRIFEEVRGKDHSDTALTLYNLGEVLVKQGNYTAAHPLLEQALIVYKQELVADHPLIADVLFNLSLCYVNLGDRKKAAELMQTVLKIREERFGLDAPLTVEAHEELNNIKHHL